MNASSVLTNNTLEWNDSSQQATLAPGIAIPIILVTGITAIVNLVFMVVCFRTLKKKFHNLLVLTLCFSDFFLAVSIVCFCLSSVSEFVQTNVKLCLFHIFTIFFGFATSYSIVFVICYERFLIVQSRNFGTGHFLDRFKYVFIVLSLGLDLMVTFQSTYFIRNVDSIESCTPANLYKDEYIKFAEILAISITFILLSIVITIIRTNCLIWTIFFKKRNTRVLPGQQSESSTDHNIDKQRDTKSDDKLAWQLPGTSGISADHRNKSSNSTSLNFGDGLYERENKSSRTQPNMIRLKIPALVDTLKQHRNSIALKRPNSFRIEKTQKSKPWRMKFDAWEKRAFTSSFIIAFMTVIFTFPFICTFWHDIYSESLMSKEMRFFFVFPLLINIVANPFIYAWRVPEIKREFQKLLNLNN